MVSKGQLQDALRTCSGRKECSYSYCMDRETGSAPKWDKQKCTDEDHCKIAMNEDEMMGWICDKEFNLRYKTPNKRDCVIKGKDLNKTLQGRECLRRKEKAKSREKEENDSDYEDERKGWFSWF